MTGRPILGAAGSFSRCGRKHRHFKRRSRRAKWTDAHRRRGVQDPVVYLESARLPTSGATYLIAQTLAANSASRIYAATLPAAPFHTLDWTRIYDLGEGANVISMTALNDRVILTEGVASVPLVFAGCLDPSGSDWASPLAAMFTVDGGENWIDISDSALDTDAESIAEIESGPGAGLIQLAICLDTPVVTGLFLMSLRATLACFFGCRSLYRPLAKSGKRFRRNSRLESVRRHNVAVRPIETQGHIDQWS